jgi:transcriptional regulator with XRE-family HTH domain
LRKAEVVLSIGDMPASVASGGREGDQTVGQLLREWRAARGVSQFDLAMRAGFSSRHVSFIETGRTQPSRHALLTIAEALDVPLRHRNRLLEAAGYAQVYRRTPLAANEMAHVRGVLQFLLDRHEPYAAIVLDRYANCLMGNNASAQMVAALADGSLISDQANHLRLVFHPLGVRRWIVNWDDVGAHVFFRAEQDLGDDDAGRALLAELRSYGVPAVRRPTDSALRPADLLLPIHISKEGLELRLFSTIMTLGTPQDVTLQELRLETFFPADPESETAWMRMVAAS